MHYHLEDSDAPHGKVQLMPKDAVFISYSHKDKRWCDELHAHLKPYTRNAVIKIWSDRQISPGSEWFNEIQTELESSKLAILLVTPNFLNSDFIHEHELGPLLKRAVQGGVTILWIPVRSSSYQHTALKNYQAVLDPSKPLAGMLPAKRDRAWIEICKTILKTADQRSRPEQSSNPEQATASAQHPVEGGSLLSRATERSSSKSQPPILELQEPLRQLYGTQGISHVELTIKNIADRPLWLDHADITSAITNEVAELKVEILDASLPVLEAEPILPFSCVTLIGDVDPHGLGLATPEFVNRWRETFLNLTCNGIIHRVSIGKEIVAAVPGRRPNLNQKTQWRALIPVNSDSSDAETAKTAWEAVGQNLERLWAKIVAEMPSVERVSHGTEHYLHIRSGQADMKFAPISVPPNAFDENKWHVLQGFYIRLSQKEPPCTWSANLWLVRSPGPQDFRWCEVSYYVPTAPFRHLVSNPVGASDHAAFSKAARVTALDVHVELLAPWRLAFGPVPVDGEHEASFHDRWMQRLANAVGGKLLEELPFWSPEVASYELESHIHAFDDELRFSVETKSLLDRAAVDPRDAIKKSWQLLALDILRAGKVDIGTSDPDSPSISRSLQTLEPGTARHPELAADLKALRITAIKVFNRSLWAYNPSQTEARQFILTSQSARRQFHFR